MRVAQLQAGFLERLADGCWAETQLLADDG